MGRERRRGRPADRPGRPKRERRGTVPDGRGHSSVGRALEWHSRGRGFDSPWLHHLPRPDQLRAPEPRGGSEPMGGIRPRLRTGRRVREAGRPGGRDRALAAKSASARRRIGSAPPRACSLARLSVGRTVRTSLARGCSTCPEPAGLARPEWQLKRQRPPCELGGVLGAARRQMRSPAMRKGARTRRGTSIRLAMGSRACA
jgi:hypothetical protein